MQDMCRWQSFVCFFYIAALILLLVKDVSTRSTSDEQAAGVNLCLQTWLSSSFRNKRPDCDRLWFNNKTREHWCKNLASNGFQHSGPHRRSVLPDDGRMSRAVDGIDPVAQLRWKHNIPHAAWSTFVLLMQCAAGPSVQLLSNCRHGPQGWGVGTTGSQWSTAVLVQQSLVHHLRD